MATDTEQGVPPFSVLVDALRNNQDKERHQKAAEEVLISHEHWLRCEPFVRAAVLYAEFDNAAIVVWRAAQKFARERLSPAAAEPVLAAAADRAMLDFAVALGADHFKTAELGKAHMAIMRSGALAVLTRPDSMTR